VKDVIWMFGGGRQSIAMLTYIARGILPKPMLAIMTDTSRESSLTWDYLSVYAKPIFEQIGLHLEIVPHSYSFVDLYASGGDLLLPVYTHSGKLPTFCSSEWKRYSGERYLRGIGYGPKNPIVIWYGMSLNEVHRMRVSSKKWIENHYPLCQDYKRRTHECIQDVEAFGFPTPYISSCWCCPNRQNPEWLLLRDKAPDNFELACRLDEEIREHDKFNAVYLHKSRVPLRQADLSTPEICDMFSECANECWT